MLICNSSNVRGIRESQLLKRLVNLSLIAHIVMRALIVRQAGDPKVAVPVAGAMLVAAAPVGLVFDFLGRRARMRMGSVMEMAEEGGCGRERRRRTVFGDEDQSV